jgi:endonuclease G
MLTMKFNATSGASEVRIYYGVYGADAASTWELWYSTNSGSTWTKTGSTVTTASTTLGVTSFTMNLNGNVRFQIRKLTGGKLNIDDLTIIDNVTSTATRDDNLAMGNPSNATTVTSNANNYLLSRSQYTLSYNNSRGSANWVSWHLSTAWKGNTPRCDCFLSDASLPSNFFKAVTSNYTNTGFDRGHLCNSEDRDGSDTDNAATFKMSNIIPQAPNLNQITYFALETYCRTLMNSGKELYIISGGYGSGGTGSNGGTTTKIANNSITVPSRIWKIIVVLPVGTNDIARVSTATRVIAVDMPNINTVNAQPWGYYRTTVDAIEASTGYNFLTNVPLTIQNILEAAVDNGPTQ